MKLYRYVGPSRIAERVRQESIGMAILSPDDVRAWVRDSAQDLSTGIITATFIIDSAGVLKIADRRSEHVVCAGGKPVQSAGEIIFAFSPKITVEAVSNQSTGY